MFFREPENKCEGTASSFPPLLNLTQLRLCLFKTDDGCPQTATFLIGHFEFYDPCEYQVLVIVLILDENKA